MSLHRIGPTKILGSSAYDFDGVKSCSADAKITKLLARGAGRTDPSYVANMMQEPQIDLEITDLATALAKFGLDGQKIPNTTVQTAFEQYWVQLDNGGLITTGATHFKLSSVFGLLVPSELSWTQGQNATLKCEYYAGYDGTNQPWTPTNNVALPHIPVIDEMFTGGPVTINGATIPEYAVRGLRLRWQYEILKKGGSGEVFPRFFNCRTRNFEFTVTTDYALAQNVFGLMGVAQGASSTNTKFFLRKMLINDDRVLDATAQHLKITLNADQGYIHVGPAQAGEENEPATCDVVVSPIEGVVGGATVPVLAISTASAIA